MEKKRCPWALKDELEQAYHDAEWGHPVHDDAKLFELLVLESMQAGLSWLTILKKRATLQAAYDAFDYQKIAQYTDEKIAELKENPGVIRNQLKIKATISNAQAFMAVQQEFGSFDHFIWSYVEHQPQQNNWEKQADVPASTELSDRISKDLKKRGFKFLGSTTIYAFMQSIGMVNDHTVDCFRYADLKTQK